MIHQNIRKYFLISFIITIALLAGGVMLWYVDDINFQSVKKLFCTNDNQFIRSSSLQDELSRNITSINSSGTVHYFYDNFDSYGKKFSTTIEQFDGLDGISLNGKAGEQKLTNKKYNGSFALSIKTIPFVDNGNINENIVVRKSFVIPLNVQQWQNEGFFSAWLNIEDRKGISSVSLKLGDINGNVREFQKLPNLQANIPNNFDGDDLFPNIDYPIKETPTDEWTDFWLDKGWNYLFWRTDKGHYIDSGQFDHSNITWLEITLGTNKELASQEIILDDLRFQSGLQKHVNPLNGVWYPPLGRPQYGIFDVDQVSGENYALKLLNVRQSQYPSNGDHGRMLLQYKTPLNFAMRVRFSLEDFPKNEREQVNTWFRLMYDFDPDYDPGHDWFGTYISLEWNRFGLITVKPLERFLVQDQEPKNKDISVASEKFTPREGVVYEEHLTVNGQDAEASIYEVVDDCLILKERVKYTFQRLRYDESKRYPVGIEITGNVKAIIREFEMKEL